MLMRLQKYMAICGVASRRKCEEYIQQGLVTVNGEVVTELGTKIDPDHDEVLFRGKLLQEEKKVSIVLYKPVGYMCSNDDPEGRSTVQELITDIPARLYHVGRLDYSTEGLLIMSNDGELANRLMHPSHEIQKTYTVLCRGLIDQDALRALRKGVLLDDGMTASAEVVLKRRGEKNSQLQISIHEGRNRQVRRMMDAVGHEVIKLRRDRIGNITLYGLEPGQWRYLTKDEFSYLNASREGRKRR